MSRTPLFQLLRRTAALAALSRRSGESLDALQQRAAEARVDAARRRFLGRLDPRERIADQFPDKTERGEGEQRGEEKEHLPPAEPVAEDASRGLPK